MTQFNPNASIDEFLSFLKENGIERAWWVFDYENNEIIASHEALTGLTQHFHSEMPDFDRHEGIFLQIGPKTGTLQGIFVHHTNRGQAAGGTRFWFYDKIEDFLFDGIRLSKGMTYKNALADLWWGGGKGVIAVPSNADRNDPAFRETLYTEYAEFVTSLKGCYVTAEDVGTLPKDMDTIFSATRFTTCIPEEKGGSGNPSKLTGVGVARAMEGALDALGMKGISGKTVSVQGSGHVARFMTEELLKKGVGRVILHDIFQSSLDTAKAMFGSEPRVEYRLIEKGDMSPLFEKADVVSPCATGGTLNDDTIPRIQAAIIAGGANNQLEDEARHAKMLQEREIVYTPDFLNNRMGIVNCANEQYGYVNNDPAIYRHLNYEWENSIYVLTKNIVLDSKKSGMTTYEQALHMTQKKMQEPHPIWGNRSRQIIRSLIEEK
ncbi:MAG: leucine dehydrogenase [Acidobacteria bacterium]|nr:MAG: leucine dehydrogenase [Acidobacteriota bacterium]